MIIINVMTFGLSGPGSQPLKRFCVPLGAVSWLAALSFVLFVILLVFIATFFAEQSQVSGPLGGLVWPLGLFPGLLLGYL